MGPAGLHKPVLAYIAGHALPAGAVSGFWPLPGTPGSAAPALRKRAEAGSRGARIAEELREEPERLMAAVQIGVTVCGTLAGVCGGWLASRHLEPRLDSLGLPDWASAAISASVLVSIVIVYVEMVLGELGGRAHVDHRIESVERRHGLGSG